MPSLVVAGAAGCAGGRPAVFYRLRDLRPVDQVRVGAAEAGR